MTRRDDGRAEPFAGCSPTPVADNGVMASSRIPVDVSKVSTEELLVGALREVALAENVIRRGQAACRYSWRIPPSKSAQPAGEDVGVKLPAAQFAAAVEAWFESQ
jgi:hypothetical protein